MARIPTYVISVPVLLFLLAAICFLIYEESWRVDGKLCASIGDVDMQECEEGDTADGYRNLCWVLIAISAVTVGALVCLLPKAHRGLDILQQAAGIRGLNPVSLIAPGVSLVLVVVFYAYFITLMLYQVSCGEHKTTKVPILPQGEVQRWSFSDAERVLVFFTVGMVLWWLSFLVHAAEFVTAALAARWVFASEERAIVHFQQSLYELLRYHMGSVLLASILVPAGRLFRNIFLGLKSLLQLVKLEGKGLSRCCLFPYDYLFKHATSSPLALLAIQGGSFSLCAKKASFLFEKEKQGPMLALNQGDRLVWLTQLVITMTGPVFVAYWIQHKAQTFRDNSTREVTSVTAMAIYELFLSWTLAQLYSALVRGLMYGYTLACLVRDEVGMRPGLSAIEKNVMETSREKLTPREAGEVAKVMPKGQDVTADLHPDYVPPPSPKPEEQPADEGVPEVPGSEAIQN